jgi:ABC-type lipoprotein release transport system permease subunit
MLLGVPLAWAAARWASGMIFVDVLDSAAVAGGFLSLALVGTLATLVPARRAASLDPNEVLRNE